AAPVGRCHRLDAAVRIDNGEPDVPEADPVAQCNAVPVGPAMRDRGNHSLNRIGVDEIRTKRSHYSAHRMFVSPFSRCSSCGVLGARRAALESRSTEPRGAGASLMRPDSRPRRDSAMTCGTVARVSQFLGRGARTNAATVGRPAVACRLHKGRHNNNCGDDGLAGGYYRVTLLLMLIAALEVSAAPLISTAVLVGSTQLLDVEFDQRYVLLAIFSALLSFMIVRQEMSDRRSLFVSGWTIATRTGIAWLVVVALLLLIGYATKVSALYSRRALFLWFT